ncbi:MAG TPA: hypothetical protein VNI54_05810 [Thermoanaerobaculia bacterium]|nr:hypothetical protein [Thermoanaerobaculia bacterium]
MHGARQLIALVLIAAACAQPPAPAPVETKVEGPRAPIRTDRESYAMRDVRLTIVATYTAPRAAYITNCNGAQPMGLQRFVNGQWVNAWVAALNGCFSEPIALQPGGQHTATLTILPGAGAITHPLETGLYRVAWYGVLASYDPRKPPHTDELPLEDRVSAPFRIEVTQQPAATTPPPPPSAQRGAEVTVSGTVLNASGHRIAHADVVAHAADDLCHAFSIHVGAHTDGNGEYAATVPMDVTCVVIDARSGGTSRQVAQSVTGRRARIDVRLPRAEPLSAAEQHQLVRLLAEAISDPSRSRAELQPYILHGPEALRVAIDHYRILLGDHVVATGMELRGANGRTSRVDITQKDLVRLHSPLLDYGFRGERFMSVYLRTIASGDAVRLSQVLNPDDIDVPVERAQEIIDDYRRRYRDVVSIRAEFVDYDETRHVLRWRLRGANGITETIDLGFGDGLIGIRER